MDNIINSGLTLKITIMKTAVKFLFLFILALILATQASFAQKKKNITGNWKTYVPDAPEGYQNWVTRITKDSIFATIEGESYVSQASAYKFKNDTLRYEMGGVSCLAAFESKSKGTGYSTWSGGESKAYFTRITDKKSKNKRKK